MATSKPALRAPLPETQMRSPESAMSLLIRYLFSGAVC